MVPSAKLGGGAFTVKVLISGISLTLLKSSLFPRQSFFA
jgi:hypothetical protein